MKNKKGVIFIICLVVIMLIVGIVLKIKNDKNEEEIIAKEKKQVTVVLSDVIMKKIARRQSGYDIEEIQTKMDEEVGNGKIEVYRLGDDIIIEYIETGHKYTVDEYVNKGL